MSPSPMSAESCPLCATTDTQAVASSRGSEMTMSSIEIAMSGTTTTTQAVTTTRAQGLRALASAECPRPGSRPRRIGPMRWYRSGTPVTSAST